METTKPKIKIVPIGHCPVTGCGATFKPGSTPHGLCRKHEEWLDFLIWAWPRLRQAEIKASETKEPSSLWKPGDPVPNLAKVLEVVK